MKMRLAQHTTAPTDKICPSQKLFMVKSHALVGKHYWSYRFVHKNMLFAYPTFYNMLFFCTSFQQQGRCSLQIPAFNQSLTIRPCMCFFLHSYFSSSWQNNFPLETDSSWCVTLSLPDSQTPCATV